MLEKPIFTYLKNAEKNSNKIRIPLKFVQKFGQVYYMEIYDDYIILKPVGKKDEQSINKH